MARRNVTTHRFEKVERITVAGITPDFANASYAAKAATEAALSGLAAFKARTDPGSAGSAGQVLGWNTSGAPVLLDHVFNVKAFGALGDAGDDTVAIQAAIDAAEALNHGSTTQGATVYFPAGIYDITGCTIQKQGITLRGAGQWATWIRGFGADMFTLTGASKLRVESMRLQSTAGAGHIFAIADSLSYALFYDLWLSQGNDSKSILWGDDTVTGTELNYIDNLWLHCNTSHTETATVASFHLRGGAVNRNRWLSGRHTYTGNYAFLIETTAASSYANDNTIDGFNMEVCTGGVVKAMGAQGLVLRDIAIYDLLNNTTRDLIFLDESSVTATLSTRSVTLENVRRNGFSLGAGLYDINLQMTSATPRVTIRNSGGSTSLAVNFNTKRALVQDSSVTGTNDSLVTYIDPAAAGSIYAETVTFKKQIKLASYTTAGRPTASTAGAGAVIWNTSTTKPNYSDGTNWRDAAGTIV